MTHFETLPAWAAIPVALLVLFGAALTLIGAIGLWRLPSFYDRLHAPTLGTSWGTAGLVLASVIMFSVAGGRAVIHEVVIAIFIMITTPVTLMLLGRAALHRDRVEGNVPFQFTRNEDNDEAEAEAKAAAQLAQAEARANMIEAMEASVAAEAQAEAGGTDEQDRAEEGVAVEAVEPAESEAAAEAEAGTDAESPALSGAEAPATIEAPPAAAGEDPPTDDEAPKPAGEAKPQKPDLPEY